MHKLMNDFYCIARVPGPDAQHMCECILSLLAGLKVKAEMIALAGDGASVIKGCNEGVAAKLRRKYPWLISVHCTAHRLNLIVAEYFKVVNEGKAVMNTYKKLHLVFGVAKNKEIFEGERDKIYANEKLISISSLIRWVSSNDEYTKDKRNEVRHGNKKFSTI